jgi:hypothetical protein
MRRPGGAVTHREARGGLGTTGGDAPAKSQEKAWIKGGR